MDDKLLQIQKLLDAADGNLSSARTMMRELTSDDMQPVDMDKKLEGLTTSEEGKVVEGVFNGEAMVGPDGQTYPVPANYASKSKLLEGDTLKLTIAEDGSFVYKQIAPIDRRNAVGTLALVDGNYTISAEGKSYKVLTASVTFYKAEPGDQVTITIPKDHDATWAVLENVIKKAETEKKIEAPMVEPTATIEPVVIEETLAPVEPTLEAPEATIDEVLSTEQAAPEVTPNIEFPNASANISDEELLQNLKSNLQKIDQPAYVAPENAVNRPVDNIVASDLAQAQGGQQPVENTNKPIENGAISELDI